jgi:hypothetical protein
MGVSASPARARNQRMDLSKLTPNDAAVTLRGLERRYRALFAGLGEDESPDDVAHRRVDGWSAIDHVVAAARALAAADRTLAKVLTTDTPTLDPADVEPQSRPVAPTGTVHERLSELGYEAQALADRISDVNTQDWNRQGIVSDGQGRRVTGLDLVRSAIDAGVTHLDGTRKVLAAVSGQGPGPQH